MWPGSTPVSPVLTCLWRSVSFGGTVCRRVWVPWRLPLGFLFPELPPELEDLFNINSHTELYACSNTEYKHFVKLQSNLPSSQWRFFFPLHPPFLSLVRNQTIWTASALTSAYWLYCPLLCRIWPSTEWQFSRRQLGLVQKSYLFPPEDSDHVLASCLFYNEWMCSTQSMLAGKDEAQSHCLSVPLLQQRPGVTLTLFDFGIMVRI